MSAGFRAVQWNRHKLVYDGLVLAGVALFLATFMAAGRWLGPAEHPVTWDILRIRAFGACAFVLLTLILSIGPLARLDPRFLPVLYNRRHLGVITCGVAVMHGWYVLGWYHTQGPLPPLVSVLASNPHYGSFIEFPFEVLGILALVILLVMAVTSHDFWLALLTPPVWKAIHMAVYAAYGLLVMHVALGVMQTERSPLIPVLLGGSFALVAALHLAADRRGRLPQSASASWIRVGSAADIPEGRALVVEPAEGERIAVFRHDGRIAAISNVCAHQNGPLGEGRIIDGCITCPWHGFQYRFEDGCAPPPFTERLSTFRVRLEAGIVFVDPQPLPPGSPAEPVKIGGGRIEGAEVSDA
jgi:nitrite reductase/ring-hydroxylating ferredoxin subunit/DMSO/TMAO reductase YedYZ heme-binding membrane subunit